MGRWRGAVFGLALLLVAALTASTLWPSRRSPVSLQRAALDAAAPPSERSAEPDLTATGGLRIVVRGPGRALVPGARVAVRSKTLRRSFTTGAAGAVTALDLPAGSCGVSATGLDGVAVAVVDVRVDATTDVELRLVPVADAVTLSGTVHDSLGGTVPGVAVWIGSEDQRRAIVVATSDATGSFSTRVSHGSHELRARAAGYAEVSHSLTLTEDQGTTSRLATPAGAST